MVVIKNIHGEVIAEIEVPAEEIRDIHGKLVKVIPADRTYDLDLSDMDLHEADLRGWDLSMAEFEDTDLTDADLSGADLSDSSIWSANLDGANLEEADLPIRASRGHSYM